MKQNTAVTVPANKAGFMQGSVERRNAAGSYMGRIMSYISTAPAGDVRKELMKADPGLRGKALRAKVQQVIRGEKHLAWAIHDAQASAARSMGYVPIKTQSNKAGDVLTTRYEQLPMSHDEAKAAIIESLTVKDLTELLDALKAKDAESKAQGESKAKELTDGSNPPAEQKQ